MGRILSKSEQLNLIREVMPELPGYPKLERMATIAAYAALVGVISERNLVTILDYAGLGEDRDRDMVYHLLRFYLHSGMITIKNEGVGLIEDINDTWEPFTEADEQIGYIVKDNINKLKRRYSPQ